MSIPQWTQDWLYVASGTYNKYLLSEWISGSQSSSFNTSVEDIRVAFPAPLHWANAQSPAAVSISC